MGQSNVHLVPIVANRYTQIVHLALILANLYTQMKIQHLAGHNLNLPQKID